MTAIYETFSTRVTPQSEAIPGEAQVANNAGGFVYDVGPWKTFERFLILGSEGGTYYVKEAKLTKDNALNVIACIEQDGPRAVDLIVAISDAGRAVKNDPAIFALALACAAKNPDTRAYALAQLDKVCRIPTHLFHFNTYVEQFRGRGRSLNRAVRDWYQNKPVDDLAYTVVKYQQRDGWSHRDLLRLTKPKTADQTRNSLYRWATKGIDGVPAGDAFLALPKIVTAFEAAKRNDNSLLFLIAEHNLSREMLPTEALTNPDVWEALLERMPITAMIRNLGVMSSVGLLKPMSKASTKVCDRLRDPQILKKGRVHPLSILVALKTYAGGHGLKGNKEWTVVPSIVDALNDAFYLAFDQMTPTGKRFIFGVDVSGSMSGLIAGMPITSAEASACLAMACAKLEREYYIMGFCGQFVDLGITTRMRLDDVMQRVQQRNFGSTDAAVPMLWAYANKVAADVFIVITDNETWAGSMHPSQALKQYRERMGIQAKEIVIGTAPTPFTIADPNDPLTLDVCGFDTSIPQVIEEFVR